MRAAKYRGFRPAKAGDHMPDERANSEPLVPSRGHLQAVRVLGFPTEGVTTDAIAATIQATNALPGDVHAFLLRDGDLDVAALREAFGVQHTPAIVISAAGQGTSLIDIVQGPYRPPYCVIDESEIVADSSRLTTVVATLVGIFAASTAQEIEVAIRGRQFRMLVWKASARADVSLGYIAGVTLRIAAGSASDELCFDESGWATSAAVLKPALA